MGPTMNSLQNSKNTKMLLEPKTESLPRVLGPHFWSAWPSLPGFPNATARPHDVTESQAFPWSFLRINGIPFEKGALAQPLLTSQTGILTEARNTEDPESWTN